MSRRGQSRTQRTHRKRVFSQRQPINKTPTNPRYRAGFPRNEGHYTSTVHKLVGKAPEKMDSEKSEQWNFDRKLDQASFLGRRQPSPPLPNVLNQNQKRQLMNEIIRENNMKEQRAIPHNQSFNSPPMGGTYSPPVLSSFTSSFGQDLKQYNPSLNQQNYHNRGKTNFKTIMLERAENNQRYHSLNQYRNSSSQFNQGASPPNGIPSNIPQANFHAPPPQIPQTKGNFYQPQPPGFNKGPPSQIPQMAYNQLLDFNNPYFLELLKHCKEFCGLDMMNKMKNLQYQKKAGKNYLNSTGRARTRANTIENNRYRQINKHPTNNYYC